MKQLWRIWADAIADLDVVEIQPIEIECLPILVEWQALAFVLEQISSAKVHPARKQILELPSLHQAKD